MKFRKITAALAATVLAFSFGGCLKYDGDILNSTTSPADTVTDTNGSIVSPDNNQTPGVTDATNAGADSEAPTSNGQSVTPNTVTEATTKGGSQTSSGNEVTTNKQTNSVTPSGTNGFDVIKSGTFYWKGSMMDETGSMTPTEMASTKDSLYMSANLSGADVALLIKGKNTYIIYPKIKGYMNMKTLMSLSGIDENMFDTSAIDFSGLGNLSDATSTKQTTFNNKSCTDYVFTGSGGTTEIFMSGNSFIGMRSTDSSGKTLSAMYVDYLTGNVPADKSAPPSGYTEYSGVKAISFMTELAKDMDVDTSN